MTALLTTTQVRALMRTYGGEPLYTNKTTGHTGNIRRVKAYYNDNQNMLAALILACGDENVTLTEGSDWMGEPGVTVRCTLG